MHGGSPHLELAEKQWVEAITQVGKGKKLPPSFKHGLDSQRKQFWYNAHMPEE